MEPVNSVLRHLLCRHPSDVQTFLGTFIGGSGVFVFGRGSFQAADWGGDSFFLSFT